MFKNEWANPLPGKLEFLNFVYFFGAEIITF